MPPKKNENVLVIQRREDNLKPLGETIKALGYRCLHAPDISKASQLIENERFKIVFFSVFEYENEGEQFLTDIKSTYPNLSLIALLADDPGEPADQAIKLGADHYLVLPGDLNRIDEIIAVAGERNLKSVEFLGMFEKLQRTSENTAKELERSHEIVGQNFLDTVKAFVGLLEMRDINMGSHCKRVAMVSRSLMDHYDLSDRVRHDIEMGALLHDIGKISIPDRILMKTRSYFSKIEISNKEREVYRQHPVIGQEAVEMVNMLSNVGTYIRHHHERFDGEGYPDGLSGFQIPLGGRIITIVDAYDKIVCSLPKKKQPEAEALFIKFVEKNKGLIFDPEVSKKMKHLINELKRQEYSDERRVSIASLKPGLVLSRDVYTKSGVLVISQYEKITGNDIARLNRFLGSNMVMEGVYIFGTEPSPKAKANARKRTAAGMQSDLVLVDNVTFSEVYKAIDSTRDFFTLPEVFETVTDKLQDAKYSRRDNTDLLLRCPVISLRILRIANSPLFNMSRKVKTVPDAAKILGMNELRRITNTTPVLDTENTSTFFGRNEFWLHMLGCGVVSGIIAKRLGIKRFNEYFTAGLFHDIGKLVLDQLYPQKFRKVLALVQSESMFYRKAERVVFNETHTNFGEYLLTKWNLSEEIVEAVKNHHAPMDSRLDPMMTSTVHLADIIAHMLHIGDSGERTVPKLEPYAEQKLGITLTDLELLIPDIDQELKKSREMIFGKSLNGKTQKHSTR